MYLIFKQDGQQKRGAAYATVQYSSNTDDETVVETTEKDLVSLFEQAKSEGEALDGADTSIDDAIEDPLSFVDYLVTEDGTISFDSGYTRDPEAKA